MPTVTTQEVNASAQLQARLAAALDYYRGLSDTAQAEIMKAVEKIVFVHQKMREGKDKDWLYDAMQTLHKVCAELESERKLRSAEVAEKPGPE